MASITKTFTAVAIMQLRDQGRLHLDDPAVAHVPELRGARTPFGAIETVTIRRMLSHESGLMSDPPGTDWGVPTYEGLMERNLARAADIRTTIPPNSQQKYSNLAYQLLGEIVARTSGIPYADYVRREILEPLGMTRSGFEPLSDPLLPGRATGYQARYMSDELEIASDPPSVWAEGGLWSCVEDLARWVALQLREDGGPRLADQIVAGTTLREMHAPRYLGNEEWTQAWCIGWYAVRRDDVIWIQHGGSIHGFTSNVCFDPKENVGAIALLNGSGADAAALAMDLATIAREAVRTAAPTIEPPASIPDAYRPLLGIYLSRDDAILARLEWRDAKLTFIDSAEPTWHPTLASTEDPSVFIVEPGWRESGEPVVFRRFPDGRVASVLLASTTFVRLDAVATRV